MAKYGKNWQNVAKTGKMWQKLAKFGKNWQKLAKIRQKSAINVWKIGDFDSK
jgi:hypothetical protein